MLESEERNDAMQIPDDDEEAAVPAWVQLAESGQLKAALVEYVRADGDVLFANLMDALGKYMEVKGDQGLAARANPKYRAVGGDEPALVRIDSVIWSLRSDCTSTPSTSNATRKFKKGLRLPILKEPTDDRIARASWLPSSLRCAPHPIHAVRLARIGRMKFVGG